MSKLKILDLCSGIGGFSLGLEATGGFETIAFCEFDPFCQKVLNKNWPEVPIYNDLKEISKDEETIRNIPEHDLICGGIPCQPFSLAGKQKGKEDDRHLWPFMFKIIEQKKPTWVIVENVGGFINVALDDVCLDLEAEGYATQSFIIPACGVEAPHRRDRIWIIGKRNVVDSKRNEHIEEIRGGDGEEREDEKRQGEEDSTSRISSGASGLRVSDQGHETSGHVADTEFKGLQGGERNSQGEGRKVLSPEQHNRDEVRSETRRISGVSGETENVADTKGNQHQRELRDGKQKNGEKKKRGKSDRRGSQLSNRSTDDRRTEDVADSSSIGQQGQRQFGKWSGAETYGKRETSNAFSIGIDNQWRIEPRVGRVANGIPNRVDRLKSLGNAIVPQIIYHIGLAILKEEE
jgi:DNA (cytosine-5)-methyltransferase 1